MEQAITRDRRRKLPRLNLLTTLSSPSGHPIFCLLLRRSSLITHISGFALGLPILEPFIMVMMMRHVGAFVAFVAPNVLGASAKLGSESAYLGELLVLLTATIFVFKCN